MTCIMHLQSMFLKIMVHLLYVKEAGKCADSSGVQAAYESVENCKRTGRGSHTVVSDLDGALTRSHSAFPYFMLVAFEAGSPLRGVVLLLMWPLIWALKVLISEAASVQLLIFISIVGIKEAQLEGVGRAVLCKFYLEDLHCHAYEVFVACGRRCVATSSPRVMVEPFLREYLGVDLVLGTELHTLQGVCTGLVKGYGVLVAEKKKAAVKKALGGVTPELGLGVDPISSSFLALCKEGYTVGKEPADAVSREDYIRPLIFHDGRLAIRPTPLVALFVCLWFPIGLVLSAARLLSWVLLPAEISAPVGAFLGVRVRIKGAPPLVQAGDQFGAAGIRGVLYVCTHRTLLDPIFLSVALRRRVGAVTYSLSRVSEMISPIKVVRLTRKREEDARTIECALKQGDLAICPEGTTCREPYLLRFSPLFAEMTDDIVPVCMQVSMTLFHGTTARGCKGMDSFYFLMNPRPVYNVTFLDPLPREDTCASGKSSLCVANNLQKKMACALGYECTTLTRRDKYRVLAGSDGLVPSDAHDAPLRIHSITNLVKTNVFAGDGGKGSQRRLPSSLLASLWCSFCNTCFHSKKV